MTVSELAYQIIALVEEERLEAYQDATGHWTIGFGHTGPDVHEGLRITSKQAMEFWQGDSAPLLKLVGADFSLSIYAAAALVSFGYNAGRSNLIVILATDPEDRPARMRLYNKSSGRIINYLVRRRAFEAALVEASLPPTQP